MMYTGRIHMYKACNKTCFYIEMVFKHMQTKYSKCYVGVSRNKAIRMFRTEFNLKGKRINFSDL